MGRRRPPAVPAVGTRATRRRRGRHRRPFPNPPARKAATGQETHAGHRRGGTEPTGSRLPARQHPPGPPPPRTRQHRLVGAARPRRRSSQPRVHPATRRPAAAANRHSPAADHTGRSGTRHHAPHRAPPRHRRLPTPSRGGDPGQPAEHPHRHPLHRHPDRPHRPGMVGGILPGRAHPGRRQLPRHGHLVGHGRPGSPASPPPPAKGRPHQHTGLGGVLPGRAHPGRRQLPRHGHLVGYDAIRPGRPASATRWPATPARCCPWRSPPTGAPWPPAAPTRR